MAEASPIESQVVSSYNYTSSSVQPLPEGATLDEVLSIHQVSKEVRAKNAFSRRRLHRLNPSSIAEEETEKPIDLVFRRKLPQVVTRFMDEYNEQGLARCAKACDEGLKAQFDGYKECIKYCGGEETRTAIMAKRFIEMQSFARLM